MKKIFTPETSENVTKNLLKEVENQPSQTTLDFLLQFARCYYVDKKLRTQENGFVLN